MHACTSGELRRRKLKRAYLEDLVIYCNSLPLLIFIRSIMIIRNIIKSNVLSIVRLGNNTNSVWNLLSERYATQRNLYSSSTNNSDKKKSFKPLSSRFGKSKNGMNELSLEHFLLRDKCVKLWRDFIRASRNIPNPIARRETVDWLRDEHFEGAYGLRNETDVVSD